MAEQGAVRRQRAPRSQACADCASLSASGAPGGAALAYYEGARLRTARRRADRKVRLKGPRQPLAPPGAPFPFLGKRKKGNRRVPRLQRIGTAEYWLFENFFCERLPAGETY